MPQVYIALYKQVNECSSTQGVYNLVTNPANLIHMNSITDFKGATCINKVRRTWPLNHNTIAHLVKTIVMELYFRVRSEVIQ